MRPWERKTMQLPTKQFHEYRFLFWYKLYKLRGYRKFCVNDASALFKIENIGDLFELLYIEKNERKVIDDFLNSLKDYQSVTVFDIGANIGVYSIIADQTIPNAEIVAFEPYPTNAYKLIKNMKLNETDVDIVQIAISDSEELVSMSGQKDALTTDGTVSLGESGHIFTYSKKLPYLIKQERWKIPDVVKIDVEGAEGKVIRGMSPIIDKIDVLYYEIHLTNTSNIRRYNDTEESIHDFITNRGFSQEMLTDHGARQIWKAVSE